MFLHDCANAIWSSKGPEVTLLFFLIIFFVKKLNYVWKGASILHLKVGSSGRPSYFQTSTPPWHTSSSRPTYYKQLVVKMEKFWHLVVVTWRPLNSSFFSNTFVHFQISGVFINKVLPGSINHTQNVSVVPFRFYIKVFEGLFLHTFQLSYIVEESLCGKSVNFDINAGF